MFQELVNRTLGDIQGQYATAYLDDIIIYLKSFEEHLDHIHKVLERLHQAGLKLKPSRLIVSKHVGQGATLPESTH